MESNAKSDQPAVTKECKCETCKCDPCVCRKCSCDPCKCDPCNCAKNCADACCGKKVKKCHKSKHACACFDTTTTVGAAVLIGVVLGLTIHYFAKK